MMWSWRLILQVLVNLYSAHMDPDDWQQPQQFRPERFLDQAGNVVDRHRVISFSLGIQRWLISYSRVLLYSLTCSSFAGSVVRYFRYLDKYFKYQRFDTSIEEASIYRGASIPSSIDTMQFAFESLYCWQLLHTAWQYMKKHVTIKLVEHILSICF